MENLNYLTLDRTSYPNQSFVIPIHPKTFQDFQLNYDMLLDRDDLHLDRWNHLEIKKMRHQINQSRYLDLELIYFENVIRSFTLHMLGR